MKQLFFILSILASFNSYALTKQEKVNLINKKSEDVINCAIFFTAKSAYFKKYNSTNKSEEYMAKATQSLTLYQYLQYGIGISIEDIKKNQDTTFENLKTTIDSSKAEEKKFVSKISNPRITKEEKHCNLALKFPRTALGIASATKPFYEKDYINFNSNQYTNANNNRSSNNKRLNTFEQTHSSIQNDRIDDKASKDKKTYIISKASIPGACFHLYKNQKSISKYKNQFNNINYYQDKANQAQKLYKYLTYKAGNKLAYKLFMEAYIKSVKDTNSWKKALSSELKTIPKAKYNGQKTYEKICDYTLKFPSTALNLNGVVKKFYASDYNK